MKHPSFSRLQDVPQLLMGSKIFPGANHTRFEHALGSYEMMRRVMVGLLHKGEFISVLDISTIELALVGALLMSVTRFPFSYAIHEFKNMDSDKKHFPTLSRKNLLERALDEVPENGGKSLWEVITCNFGDVKRDVLVEVLCGSNNEYSDPHVQFTRSLLHSTIDVRVLDFLACDAYHIGLDNQPNYSGIVDFLALYGNRVAVHSRGVSYVEQVIVQRYWMFKQVYWNEPNRLYTALLIYVFHELESEEFEGAMSAQIMKFSAESMLDWLSGWAETHGKPDIAKLIRESFLGYRAAYRRLFTVNSVEASAALDMFCDRYSGMSYKNREKIRAGLQALVLREIGDDIEWDESRLAVLVDMPSDVEKKLGADVTVISYDGHPVKLFQQSGIALGLDRGFDEQLRWLRVFAHKEVSGKIKIITASERQRGVPSGERLENRIKDRIKEYLISWTS